MVLPESSCGRVNYTSRHANKKYFGQDRYSFSYLGVLQRTSLNMSFKHIFQVKVKQHFLHEKGREQTLRRETWSTLLQITLRVFFMSQKHGNHKNKHKKKQERVISGKKGPCQEAGMPHPSLYRSKMSPLTFPTHRNPLNPFSIHFNSFLMETVQIPRSRYSFLIAGFLIAMTRGV